MITSRYAWAALAASALALELAALFFQHVMELEPCILCVYQRTAVLGILAAGLIGVLDPSRLWLRVPAYVLWGAGAGWGLYLAGRQTGMQLGMISAFDCSFEADFPAWAELDRWLPWAFQPSGYCDEVQWQLLGLSMAQWLLVICAAYLIALGAVLIAEVRRAR